MINRVVLVGRLTKDPELRYTPNGVAVSNFTVAVNRPFTNQQGDRDADFIQVVVWRRQAENTANYVGKGSQVGIDGRLQTRSFENSEGRRVFMTEVVADSVQFLEPRGSKGQGQGQGQGPAKGGFGSPEPSMNTNSSKQPQTQGNNPFDEDPFANDGKPIDISDDDLPF